MGQARKRGSFEERKDAAIKKRQKLLDLFPKTTPEISLTDLALVEKLAKPKTIYVKGD